MQEFAELIATGTRQHLSSEKQFKHKMYYRVSSTSENWLCRCVELLMKLLRLPFSVNVSFMQWRMDVICEIENSIKYNSLNHLKSHRDWHFRWKIIFQCCEAIKYDGI